jgi:hypothetical protein
MFTVYCDDKECLGSNFNIPENLGWNQATYETFGQALFYLKIWLGPYSDIVPADFKQGDIVTLADHEYTIK